MRAAAMSTVATSRACIHMVRTCSVIVLSLRHLFVCQRTRRQWRCTVTIALTKRMKRARAWPRARLPARAVAMLFRSSHPRQCARMDVAALRLMASACRDTHARQCVCTHVAAHHTCRDTHARQRACTHVAARRFWESLCRAACVRQCACSLVANDLCWAFRSLEEMNEINQMNNRGDPIGQVALKVNR